MPRGTLKMLKGVLYDIFFLKEKKPAKFFSGASGSFGGGGATASWGAVDRAIKSNLSSVTVLGDVTCPPTGVRKFWRYADYGAKVFGPHPVGHNHPFMGFVNVTPVWNTLGNNMVVSQWEQDVNGVMAGFPTQLYRTVLGHVNLPQDNDYGNAYTILNNPDGWGFGTIFREDVADETLPTIVGPNRKFPIYYRTFWERDQEACTPPHPVFYNPKPFDRWARTSYPYDPRDLGDPDKEPKKDDDGGLFIPPFIFSVPLGPPISGPPSVGLIPSPSGPGVEPPPREPPKRNERVRKKKGSLKTIFKLLDVISESAEVVDCFFDALPKPIRNKWQKDRPNRGLTDTAGQYGIDGADWKAAAIYHNWDKVDINKAFECIALNEISDKIVGKIMSVAPPQAGVALSGLSREFYLAKKKKDAQHWAAVRAENAARSAAFKKKRAAEAAARKGGKKSGKLQKTR